MYKKTLFLALSIIGLIILALGIYAYAFSTVTQNQTKAIDASEGFNAQLNLEQGVTVYGTLTILDGNQGIEVYVENPAKELVYDGGTVSTSLEFNFYVQTSGVYSVNFDNISPDNQQTIEYSLKHSIYSPTLSLGAMIIGAIILIISITTALISRLHSSTIRNII